MNYRKKISGPILDRIDIQVHVPRETQIDGEPMTKESFDQLKSQIIGARALQQKRFAKASIYTNSEINYKNIDKWCVLTNSAEMFLRQTLENKGLSLRSYHKIKKLGRTIADLDGSELIEENHIAQAVALNVNDQFMAEFA